MHIIKAMLEHLAARVVAAPSLACWAERLAREAKNIQVNSWNGPDVPLATILVDMHVLSIQAVNQVANMGVDL